MDRILHVHIRILPLYARYQNNLDHFYPTKFHYSSNSKLYYLIGLHIL